MIVVKHMCPGKGMTYDENILNQKSFSRILSVDEKKQPSLIIKCIAPLWYSFCMTHGNSGLDKIKKQHGLFLDRVGEIIE